MAGRKSLLDRERCRFDTDIAFVYWAYGDSIPSSKEEKKDAWNRRHGDKLYLQTTDKILDGISRMIKIYYNDLSSVNYSEKLLEEQECV